jgi:hypothetical protein
MQHDKAAIAAHLRVQLHRGTDPEAFGHHRRPELRIRQ